MPDRCTRTTTALIALIAGLPLLAGCSDRDTDSSKIAESARNLGAVGSAASAEDYAAVSASIAKQSFGGETATAASAGLLAQSLQGEGSVEISTATLGERALLEKLDAVLGMGRRFETLMTTAEAMDAFDPSADIDSIAGLVEQLEAASRAQQSARADLAGRIDSLESQIASLRSGSTAKRDRAAEMKLESASMSAVQAASRAGAIRTLTRESDALDMQISSLTGETESLRPRLAEIDAEVSKLAQQRELTLESADELRAMTTDRTARAETARAGASAIAEQIREAVNAIDATRGETVIPAGEDATASLESAVRESEKASRKLRSAGSLSKAAAQRRLAEMSQIRAHGHDRYAAALEKLAAIQGLPGADGYASAAGEERARADALREAAGEAYESAASSLTAVSIRGTDSSLAEETAERLRELARLVRGDKPEAAEPDAQPAP